MASTTDLLTPTAAAADAAPRAVLPVTGDTLLDASLYTAIVVALFAIGLMASPERRRELMTSALLSAAMLGALWGLANYGSVVGSGTLYEIARELFLALLAFAVIRGVLIFVARIVLLRFQVPRILTDVLLTLALIVYALYRLNVIGVNLAGIVTTSAVITGAIAFSAQEILGALWAGLALQGERSLRQGDWIRYNDKLGEVVQLRWRSTAIATCDHETIIIPNASLMKDKITLVGRQGEESSHARRRVPFSVSYEHSPNKVVHAINQALGRAEIHNVARDPAPFCVCTGFADSGINYDVLYHIVDLHHYPETDSSMLAHIFAALKRHDMSIPFPHRVVQMQTEGEERSARREREKRLALLAELPLFRSLTAEEREALAAELMPFPFVADDIVCRQGEAADSLFVLASGHLEVFHDEGRGERTKLASLHAPAYFGERGLLLGQPRGATIVAAGDAHCYRLDRRGFDAILRARPEIVEDLSKVLAQRQAENDAKLQALDAEARAQQTSGYAADMVRMIRGFFGLSGGGAQR